MINNLQGNDVCEKHVKEFGTYSQPLEKKQRKESNLCTCWYTWMFCPIKMNDSIYERFLVTIFMEYVIRGINILGDFNVDVLWKKLQK
jgi:hypothetical protein